MEQDFYPAYFELEGRHWWFLGRRAIFMRLLERRIGERADRLDILDFGCGTGAFLAELDRFVSGSAVDGDEAAVAFCHQRGRSEVRYVAPGAALPFADASFDLITTLEVIEDDVAALRDLHPTLRPGGLLLVAVPAFMLLGGDQDEISHHFRRYTDVTLRRSLACAGLDVEQSSSFNALLFAPIAGMRLARRLVRRASAERTDFDIGPAALNAVLARLFAAEERAVSGRGLPVGVSLLAVARRR